MVFTDGLLTLSNTTPARSRISSLTPKLTVHTGRDSSGSNNPTAVKRFSSARLEYLFPHRKFVITYIMDITTFRYPPRNSRFRICRFSTLLEGRQGVPLSFHLPTV